jgi:hypothetical protein
VAVATNIRALLASKIAMLEQPPILISERPFRIYAKSWIKPGRMNYERVIVGSLDLSKRLGRTET